jgi:hypothetical protein
VSRNELKRRESIGDMEAWMGLDGPSRRIIVQPQEQPEQPSREVDPAPVETPEREPEKVPA